MASVRTGIGTLETSKEIIILIEDRDRRGQIIQ
jgi:hypothetical protein